MEEYALHPNHFTLLIWRMAITALPTCTLHVQSDKPTIMQTVLIIDNHEDLLENMTELLSLEGYRALSVKCPKKGLYLAVKLKPDLIISSVQMDPWNGFQLLDALNSHTDTATIPFVFCSGLAQKTDIEKARQTRALHYLLKPFSDKTLFTAVKSALTPKNHKSFNPILQDITA